MRVRARRCERGVTLVESLVAVAILGAALVVFLSGLSTGALATNSSDRLSTAHELARSQMELTKAAAYSPAPAAYPTVTPPTGFAVSALASAMIGGDAGIQLITVEVSRDGAPVYTLEGVKVDR